ncbi:ParB N-terminal domain-containing protein (plasmid) [Ectopseudomonas mendocina]
MSSRRQLGAVIDDHANVAAAHLLEMEAARSERMDTSYPLAKIIPSVHNPRRKSLDAAGVTRERIEELKKQPGENIASWTQRLDNFMSGLKGTISAESYGVWEDLIDLAVTINGKGLIQPIVATLEGEIVAGERRWTACQIAGLTHARVILRQIDPDTADVIRLLENVSRSDLSIAAIAESIRKVMAVSTGEPCGPRNNRITIKELQAVIGGGRTQCAYYRAICRLDENDPLLAQIVAGAYTSLRTAYEHASKRMAEYESTGIEPPAPPPVTAVATPANDATPARNTPPAPPLPQFKARIPGTEGGMRFIDLLGDMQGLSEETQTRIKAIRTGWAGAPDKARKKMFSEVLSRLFTDLDQLDEDAEGEQQ